MISNLVLCLTRLMCVCVYASCIAKLILLFHYKSTIPMGLLSEGMLKSDPSESQKSKANRLETPDLDVYYPIINKVKKLGIDPPELDVFASVKNSKCLEFISKEQDAFVTEFLLPSGDPPKTIWSNAPHDIYRLALPRIHQQYLKYDFNAVVLIPTTNMRTNYWNDIVEPNRIEVNPKGYCFYYPYKGTIYFELDHQRLRDKKDKYSHSHNGYNILLFVKKNKIKDFKERLQEVFCHE